ncbi:hypothetical protein NEOKW01_0448 [Nematocida sp. AWRm80]|nr:hypothetical protein NEOKW01_0448 [Nematocida sp. AWRm80]
MDRFIERELKETNGEECLERVFNEIFTNGNASLIKDSFIKSISPFDQSTFSRMIVQCRQSKREFANWIFKYIAQGEKTISQEDITRTQKEIQTATGIPSTETKQNTISEEDFINMCLSSKEFVHSWEELRRQTRI